MRAAFFDLDGTLFDTRADIAATVNHTRDDLGLAPLPEDVVIGHVGQGARYLLEHAIPERAADYARTWEAFARHYAEHCIERLKPYEGVEQTLDELIRRGWRLGLVTNKPNFAVRKILNKFGFGRYFGSAVVAGGDCAEMKPDAAPLMACAAHMDGHEPTPDDWMVGDSWTDLACAANAGVSSAFCAFGFGRRREAGCTRVLSRFGELLEVL